MRHSSRSAALHADNWYVCCYVKYIPFICSFYFTTVAAWKYRQHGSPSRFSHYHAERFFLRPPARAARRANKIIIIVRTQSVPRVVTKIYRPLFPTLALAFRQAESIRPFSEPWLCVPNAAPWLRSA